MSSQFLVAVMGPTAAGKTEVAEAVAEQIGAQLINADAFQVYRGMDIGTAKPERRTRYELLDIRNPDEGFGLGEFVRLTASLLHDLFRVGKSAVLVGGTGLYIRAVFEEYADLASAPSPELRAELSAIPLEELVTRLMQVAPYRASQIDLRNPVRVQRSLERALAPTDSLPVKLPAFRKMKLAIVPPVETLSERIACRCASMVGAGWIAEVERLREMGYRPTDPGLRAIGYRTIWRHLDGEVELEEALAATIAETRKYAKRQRTWLRSEPDLTVLDWQAPLDDASRRLRL